MTRVGSAARPENESHGITAGRQHQLLELPWIFLLIALTEIQVNQYRQLAARRPVKKHGQASDSSSVPGGVNLTGREGTTVDTACL